MTTPTPRTDAAIRYIADATLLGGSMTAIVPADFARQLETELSEARAERDAHSPATTPPPTPLRLRRILALITARSKWLE